MSDTDWMLLERLWKDTLEKDSVWGVSSGEWKVQKETSGPHLGPIAGNADEIVIYRMKGKMPKEVGRWRLEDVRQ